MSDLIFCSISLEQMDRISSSFVYPLILTKSKLGLLPVIFFFFFFFTGPRSAVNNVSGYRYVSDCRSRGREFDPGPVPYFRGD